MSTRNTGGTEGGILARLVESGRGRMAPALAKYVLTLGFDQEDQDRMTDLAARNQAGRLSPTECDELMGYVRAGHLLAFLHSRARKALKFKARA